MRYRFPLKDVTIEISSQKREVKSPVYNDGFYVLNQNEFSMDVPEAAWFYASGGNFISIVPYHGSDSNKIELYLNGSVYGAILHQRKVMPLHGSCFMYKTRVIMFCGESGAGKSSLTAAFCKNGASFLTDDVTPLVFSNGLPFIIPLSDRIKLWDNSLKQLNMGNHGLEKIWEDYNKFYLPLEVDNTKHFPLHQIFIIEKQEDAKVSFHKLIGAERFAALRNEIYRWEYMEGMKDSEASYLSQLIHLSLGVEVTKVIRPELIGIESFRTLLAEFISKRYENSGSE